ncbi:hypothetical protein [Endozoicomonas sp. Mp262]|uniref:hypothetical protein n=1 Tax=Endozoicomonas sp. Mp262 TaxID=2919499 RepID=UPI0021E0A672
MGPTDKPSVPKTPEVDRKSVLENEGASGSDSGDSGTAKKGLFRGRKLFRKDNEQKPTARFYGVDDELKSDDVKGPSRFYTDENNGPTPVRKYSPDSVLKRKTTGSDAPGKNIKACISAVNEGRLITPEEFYGIAGKPNAIGDVEYKQLGKLLQGCQGVFSDVGKAALPLAEVFAKVLDLREKAQAFVEKYGGRRKSDKHNERIRAVESLLFVIDESVLANKKASQVLCDSLGQGAADLTGKRLLKSLFSQPRVFRKLLSTMSLVELLTFSNACQRIKQNDCRVASAFMSGASNALSRLSSAEIKRQYELYLQSTQDENATYSVSDNSSLERNRVLMDIARSFFDGEGTSTDVVAAALYQSYQDGNLTMSMLDQVSESAAIPFGFVYGDPESAPEALIQLEQDFKDQGMQSLEIGKDFFSFLEECRKDPNLLLKNPKYAGTFLKIKQSAIMLAGEPGSHNDGYRDFVQEWDKLRFRVMPDYNNAHGKDDLVDTVVLSLEAFKITPDWLKRLNAAQGNLQEVRSLLNEMGWRKSPDHINFRHQLKVASSEESKGRVKALACQDCLFRYFAKRAGFEPAVLSPDPQRKSKPALKPEIKPKPRHLSPVAQAREQAEMPVLKKGKRPAEEREGVVKPKPLGPKPKLPKIDGSKSRPHEG